jgi:hypothetical protein
MRSLTAACAATLLLAAVASFAQLQPPAGALNAPAPAAAPASAPADPVMAQKEADARLAAQGWLVLLDRRDWGRSWETTSTVFRGMVPVGTWMDGIPKVRDPLGAYAERKIVESAYKTSLAGQPPGEYVTVVFESKFANRPIVIEAVTTVLEKDGKWRVTGYSAQ